LFATARSVIHAGMLKRSFALLLGLLFGVMPCVGDTLEFKNGSKISGEITRVDEAAQTVSATVTLRGRQYPRTYRFGDLLGIVQNGRRRDMAASEKPADQGEAAIVARIESEGASDPAWLAATKLNYPPTLDLSWPNPAPKPWNSQKNMGQFIWDVVNPNASRWREGVKLMYAMMERHRDDREKLQTIRKSLASMYYRFFQDYARAAYWWRQSDLSGDHGAIQLADCYFRLGSKDMAMKQMAGNPIRPGAVKLLGAMGEADKAVNAAEVLARSANSPHEAYLAAADALALAGRFQEALKYYDKVVTDPRAARNKEYDKRFKDRARESAASIRLFELLDIGRVKEGAYSGSASGYNGAVAVTAEVAGGKVVSVRVTKHREKQYYSAISDVPGQILAKQSVKDIDATSGATITAQAIVNATAAALAGGQ
jgi:uncharacterized protein with FMN-binding domain